MEITKMLEALKPLKGEVIPIRTIQETEPPEEDVDAYVAEISLQAASAAKKAVESAFPGDPSRSMAHLRRFVKRPALPKQMVQVLDADGSDREYHGQTIFILISPPLPEVEAVLDVLAPFAPPRRRRSSATSSHPNSPPTTASSPDPQPSNIRLLKIRVPLHPPFSIAQAETLTREVWPVIFNPAAPRTSVAPPPKTVTAVMDSIKPRAGCYLALARKLAEESLQSGRGRGVGAVIVDPVLEEKIEHEAWCKVRDPNEFWMDAVVSVAGDARYGRLEAGLPSQADRHHGVVPNPAISSYSTEMEGGPDLHALMRAVELVSRRRREDGDDHSHDPHPNLPIANTDPQLANELSPLESYFLYEICDKPILSKLDQPLAAKKRKHEESTGESPTVPWDGVTNNTRRIEEPDEPTPTSEPPSSSALAETTISTPGIDPPSPSPEASDSTAPPQHASRIRTPAQGGYLCTQLDIYLSHEPCISCSMGMLLSRFRAVIFPRAGRLSTGGIVTEPVVQPAPVESDLEDEDEIAPKAEDRMYYGLHWRREMNWRALGYEFVEGGKSEEVDQGDGVPPTTFHA